MSVNSRLFWICMCLLVAAMVFVYTVQAIPQPTEPRTSLYTVLVNWLDGSTTTVSSDHVYIKDGWIAIHVTQDPVGMMFLPAFSVSSVTALELPPEPPPKVLSVEVMD